MGDVDRTKVHIKEPGTLKVGRDEMTEIKGFFAGTVAIDVPSATTLQIVSASAAITGMTTGFSIQVQAKAWAALEEVIIQAAAAGDGIVTVTAFNASSATRNATSQDFSFFAWSV